MLNIKSYGKEVRLRKSDANCFETVSDPWLEWMEQFVSWLHCWNQYNNNNNNNNCLKSNIQCIEIRVQWTVHLGSSHMHVHAVTRVHAVTPKLVICVMYLTSIWRILLMTDGLNAVWSNDRAAHTDTNPKNHELAPPQSITATRLDQLVYSPNYYIQIFQTQNNCPQWEANLRPARSESWAFATTPRELYILEGRESENRLIMFCMILDVWVRNISSTHSYCRNICYTHQRAAST